MLRIIFTSLLMLSPALAADDRPSLGMVYNTQENSSLTFDCNQSSQDALACSFTQTAVRKKASSQDLVQKLQAARDEFRKGQTPAMKPEECASYDKLAMYLKGGAAQLSADQVAAMQKIDPKTKTDLLASLSALSAFCKSPTEDNLINLVRTGHDKDVKSCRVTSHNFTQNFKRVARSDTWVANDGPTGQCGIVVISQLEKVAVSGTSFWTYTTKKVITNPKSSSIGMACGEFDQAEYFYDWRSKEAYVGCDYILF